MPAQSCSDPAEVAEALAGAGYVPDDGVATAAFLAIRIGRPLFVKGDRVWARPRWPGSRCLARTVVWVNPHLGKTGRVAATAGMQAALPGVDHLVSGHTFEAMTVVADVIARA